MARLTDTNVYGDLTVTSNLKAKDIDISGNLNVNGVLTLNNNELFDLQSIKLGAFTISFNSGENSLDFTQSS